MRVTRDDVAKRAGVSPAVVSYVINNGPRPVAPETRQRVLTAIKELGYRTNIVARSLRLSSKRTQTLGLIVPDTANAFFSEVAKGIEDAAFTHNHNVILCNTNSDPQRQYSYISTMIARQVDGIILVTTPVSIRELDLLAASRIPAVYVDPESDLTEEILERICTINVDGVQGGYLAGKHLLGQGHRRMACIGGAHKVPPGSDRVAGFLQALDEGSASASVTWAGDSVADGYKAASVLLQSTLRPTAIFACNDLLAIGALRAAADHGLQIPRDLAVVGFDDIDLAQFTVPRLTTIQQPKFDMGYQAAEMLITWLENTQDADLAERELPQPRQITLQTQLVIRESA